MFWSAKKEDNRHIIAIKDYTNTLNAMKAGTFYLPFEKEIYFKLLENYSNRVDKLEDLGKFIKSSNKKKADVLHFWECLISNGYALINVKYEGKNPSIEKLCCSDSIKYVAEIV